MVDTPRTAPVERVERWPVGKLLPYARNPKTHPPEQVALIAKSMARFGQAQLILVDGDEGPTKGEVIAGHGRVLAAASLGWDSLMVGEARGWSEDEKRAYRIADNQLSSELLAPWDMTSLKVELGQLSLAGFDMPLIGFDNMQLKQFFAGKGGEADPEEAPEVSPTPVVKMGDLWLLADHRLLCGDCTKAEDVERLLGEARPHLMVTDPPYGVNYDPKWRDRDLEDAWTAPRATGAVQADDRCDWTRAWQLFSGDVLYAWHPAGAMQIVHHSALVAAGFDIRMQIIWAKQHFPIGRGNYHVQHEPCWYAVRRGKTAHWQGDRTQSTLWAIANASAMGGKKDDVVSGHGTQKPIECMRKPIENNSRAGDTVYDPFVGSGTTIIAAEMTARHCLALDIDPGYVQVSVERWQKFTGKKAILDGDGRDFDTIKAERLRSAGRRGKVVRGGVPGDPGKNGGGRSRVAAKRKGRRGGGPSVAKVNGHPAR